MIKKHQNDATQTKNCLSSSAVWVRNPRGSLPVEISEAKQQETPRRSSTVLDA